MDLLTFARILRRRWLLLAALTCLGLILGTVSWVLQRDQQSFYRATHTLVQAGSDVNLNQAAAVATTGEVPDRVAARLPGSTPAELAAQVKVTPRADVGFVEVTAVGTDPARTVEVADAFADELSAYMGRLRDRGREAQVAPLEQRVEGLNADIAQLQVALESSFDVNERAILAAQLTAKRNEAAQAQAQLERLRDQSLAGTALQTLSSASAVPISGPQFRELFRAAPGAGPDPASAIAGTRQLGLLPRLVLGAAFGLLIGIAAALLLERLDPRLRTKTQTEEVYGWPVITEVPPLSRQQQHDRVIMSVSAPRSRAAESYRVLRSSVQLALAAPVDDGLVRPERGDGDGHVVLVTSASPAEGKTTTVANLAAALGEAGTRVVVVNCDFRRPALGAYLGVDTHLAKVVDSGTPNVWVLPQVSEHPEQRSPAEVLAAQHEIIAEARRRFDVVLLDTAPLLTTNDANEVLDTADLVVVVARAGRTTREAADRCAELLERRRAPVLGVVLIAAADAPSGSSYYYGDYYIDDKPGRGGPATPGGAGAAPDAPGDGPAGAPAAGAGATPAGDAPASGAPAEGTPGTSPPHAPPRPATVGTDRDASTAGPAPLEPATWAMAPWPPLARTEVSAESTTEAGGAPAGEPAPGAAAAPVVTPPATPAGDPATPAGT